MACLEEGMTDEMIWALRTKHEKGYSVNDMSADYGIPRRVIAAVVGIGDRRDGEYWACDSLWEFREMLCGGYGMDEIAGRFGVTRKSLARVVDNNRDLFRAFDRRG